MTTVGTLIRGLYADVRREVQRVAAFRATAASAATGKVTIQRPAAATADGESYARLDGFSILSDDQLICWQVSGKPVCAKVITATPTTQSLAGSLVVGQDLSVVNDVTVTNDVLVSGTLAAGATTVASINTPLCRKTAASNSATASTTDTVNYSPALTVPVTLPTGTWTVRASGSVNLQHSAGGNSNVEVTIDGEAGTAANGTAPSASWTRIEASHARTGRSGTIDVVVRFRSSTAGTTSADNPSLDIWAERTA